jgi:hypothetical protein
VNELLDASLHFPTVIFTAGLSIALIYWLFVLLGALDVDLFHADFEGAAKGGAEAIKGSVEALKGVKPDLHADVDGGVWDLLGLAAVPITISFSAVMLVGWVGSLLAMSYGQSALGGLGGWLAPLVLLVVILIGVPVAGLLVRPLGPVFEVRAGKTNRDYVGATCTITTGHVDDGFGQATVEDGGTVLVIPVRCDRKDALVRNQRAIIIDYDDGRAAYDVEPESGLAPSGGV